MGGKMEIGTNKTEKFILLDNNYEFNMVKEDDDYFFYYSHSEQWNLDVRGTLAFSVINTGNELKISSDGKRKLNYSEAFLLYLALREEYKDYNIQSLTVKK